MPRKKTGVSRKRTKPEETASSANNADAPLNLNLCRLCQRDTGPFLDLFADENVTVRKIEELMPFKIPKDDQLPKKICFRCSAKVEELYEFVKTCTRTQTNISLSSGKPSAKKAKTPRTIWEEQLDKSNITNEFICDAIVKKAMVFMGDIQLPTLEQNKVVLDSSNTSNASTLQANDSETSNKVHEENPIEPIRLKPKKVNNKKVEEPLNAEPNKPNSDDVILIDDDVDTNLSDDLEARVSIIKVNGFGILFQCKLCNRNFLKKSIVANHNCTLVSTNKINRIILDPKPSEIPKPPNVKYIYTSEETSAVPKSNPVANITTQKKEKPGPASKVRASKLVTSSNSVDNDQSLVPNTNKPYPVGFFCSQLKDDIPNTMTKEHVIFSTTALHKQSYSVVKTATPGKILISSKPSVSDLPSTSNGSHGIEDSKKSHRPGATQGRIASRRKSYHPKSPDKNLAILPDANESQPQPSYVLPLDTTVGSHVRVYGDPKYECPICHVKFSREGKVAAHMKVHQLY